MSELIESCPEYRITFTDLPGVSRVDRQSALDVGELGDAVVARRRERIVDNGSGPISRIQLSAIIVDGDRLIAVETMRGSVENAEPDEEAFVSLVHDVYKYQHDALG